MLKRAFKQLRAQVDTAMTLSDASGSLEKNRYDGALVDYHLPDGYGHDLLKRFKKMNPDCVFLLMTNDPNPKLALDWMKNGGSAYIQKPFDTEYLMKIFSKARREKVLLRVEDILEARTRELRKSEARYRVVVENANDAILLIQQGKIQYANPAALQITGYGEDELKSVDFFDLFHPDDRKKMMNQKNYVTQERAAGVALSCRIITASGKERSVEFHSSLIQWENKPSLVCFMQDVTRLKAFECQLLQSQKTEPLGVLTGGIAHDLNNFLFPILGMAELLLQDFPEESPEHAKAHAIFKAGSQCRELIQRLLTFGKNAKPVTVTVKLQTILTEILHLIRCVFSANITVSHRIDMHCGSVMGDPTQLHQMVMNLLTNAYYAVKTVSHGKIEIDLSTVEIPDNDGATFHGVNGTDKTGWFAFPADRRLEMEPGRYAVVTIRDNGCGISPEVMEHIFDPYFTTKGDEGTGLGLYVTATILKSCGGHIQVKSAVGEGTIFTVFYPLKEKKQSWRDKLPSTKSPSMASGNERILLVDDEALVANIMTLTLERLGYKVTQFVDPAEALLAFKGDPTAYDLVLTDLSMSPMNGKELAKEILSVREDLPVLFCTGYASRMNEKESPSMGAKALLKKPVSQADLACAVRAALDESVMACVEN